MISIPLYVFAIIYLVLLAGISIFAFVNIFHLIHTGTITVVSITVTFLFLVYSFAVLWYTATAVAGVNWSAPLIINFSSWFTGAGGFGL